MRRLEPCPEGAVHRFLVLKAAWRSRATWRGRRRGRGAAAPRLLRPLGWPRCPWRGGSVRDGDRLPERPQRSAACAAISLAPPSPPAPSALSMRSPGASSAPNSPRQSARGVWSHSHARARGALARAAAQGQWRLAPGSSLPTGGTCATQPMKTCRPANFSLFSLCPSFFINLPA